MPVRGVPNTCLEWSDSLCAPKAHLVFSCVGVFSMWLRVQMYLVSSGRSLHMQVHLIASASWQSAIDSRGRRSAPRPSERVPPNSLLLSSDIRLCSSCSKEAFRFCFRRFGIFACCQLCVQGLRWLFGFGFGLRFGFELHFWSQERESESYQFRVLQVFEL